ncbi:MAG: hypothetical protein LBC59_06880 [Chitinispirillales bacterium]|nr:hypothetical protein [Chitinispirillales bacterium]
MYDLKDYIQMISNIIICVGVIIAIWQLLLSKNSITADHERRKKQATIEFYRSICDACDEILEQLEIQFPNDGVINYDDVKNDPVALNAIRKYLSLMEEIAVGINTEVYDITIFDRIAGTYCTGWFRRFSEIIRIRRINNHYPNLYGDFENMIYKLKDVKKKRFNQYEYDLAKIKHDVSK